ncbi:hypothetical protein [Photobacterium leiognathi]|uniref:hypothetical protein n=1 Tax=Photobacterium leiognathi TaxID=553611 RepID=UPI002981A20F|nr:hypothetical protein [Photobacterium leiognathi]
MATYRIENSFDTGYGSRLNFSAAYDNDGASDNDFNNAPCYVNCLFDANGEKVEP